jgi:hypothetical protein
MRELGWDELIAYLDTASFTGLLFEGQFMEFDGIKRFLPMSTPVYLETATSLLKLSTGVNNGNVFFSVVDAPTWESFGEDWEEMDEVGVVDVGSTYFGDDPVQCTQLRCAIDNQPGPENGEVLLVEMTFTREQRVLFDPWWDAFRVQTAMSLESAHIFTDFLAGKVDVREWSRPAAE